MSKTVTLSEDAADLLEQLRRAEGLSTLDAAAELAIARSVAANDDDFDGYTVEELKALIEEAEEGPSEAWDAQAVRAEVLRRASERNSQP